MKSNNSSNQLSQSAKEAGLSYWEYIASTQPHHVQRFSMETKEEARKTKPRKHSGPTMGLASKLQNMLGRSTY